MQGFMDHLLENALNASLAERLTRETREAVAERLCAWLRSETRRVAVADLADRLALVDKRIRDMCDSMSIDVGPKGSLSLKVAGVHSDTLAMLRRGSTWFEGDDKIEDLVLATVFENLRRI